MTGLREDGEDLVCGCGWGEAAVADLGFQGRREGGDVGVPVTVSDPAGEAAQAFEALAKEIASRGPSRVYRSELTLS